MTLGDAHHGDLLRLRTADGESWQAPVRLLTDPAPCHDGCCCSRGVTADGRVLPVHAATGREVLLIEPGPGGAQ